MFRKLIYLVSFVLVLCLTNMVSAQIIDDFDDGDIGTNNNGIGNGFHQHGSNASENAEQSAIHFNDKQSGMWSSRAVNSKDEFVFIDVPIKFIWQISNLSTISGNASEDVRLICGVVTNDIDPASTEGALWNIDEGGFWVYLSGNDQGDNTSINASLWAADDDNISDDEENCLNLGTFSFTQPNDDTLDIILELQLVAGTQTFNYSLSVLSNGLEVGSLSGTTDESDFKTDTLADELADGVWVGFHVKNRNHGTAVIDLDRIEVSSGPIAVPFNPSPGNKAIDVPRDGVMLSWTPGELADTHDVYFGTNFDDVNDAADTSAVYIGRQSETTYALDRLDLLGQTYYWRIDEVNAPPDSTVFKGCVWSFTTEPYAYLLANIAATASSSNSADMGPAKSTDGSGLNASDQHSVEPADMWLSSATGPQPTWIQYEFDMTCKLLEMWAWNSNQMLESLFGLGAKDVTVEYSEDGVSWASLGDVEFAQAPGSADYTHDTTVDMAGAMAKYVRLTINSNWGGLLPQFGLSEVRFFYIPVQAREPKPISGGKGVERDVVLDWRAGREAASHEVSFSSDKDAVINGTAPVDIATESRYEPGLLEFGQIYYWKVNEVNDVASPSSWEGDLWSFSTIEYLVIDDFEGYDTGDNQIWFAWHDGLGYGTAGTEPYFAGNGTGAAVGDETTDSFTEEVIVHGGNQAMPVFYDNNQQGKFKYSEAELTLSDTRDWTVGGVTELSLWFHGEPNNTAETLYVAVNGSAVVSHNNPDAALITDWTQWNIDLQAFADQGVNLANVNTIALGLGDKTNPAAGGSGKMYFDDIAVGHPIKVEIDTGNILANGGFENDVAEP